MSRRIFVFGSNTTGRHGKGAALFARQNHGAIYGQGDGLQGNSYAIATRFANPVGVAYHGIRSLTLAKIRPNIERFVAFAHAHPELTFDLTRVGCGLGGFSDAEIAPMFKGIPSNVIPPKEFLPYL